MRGSQWGVVMMGLVGLLGSLQAARGASQAPPKKLPQVAPLTARDRLLVLAPHCDDETLATGGLIQQALAARAKVQVVIITNGDGFRSATESAFDTSHATPEEYLSLGLRRQRESLAGLAQLGLSPQQATFLGYPDGALVRLWLEYWEDPQRYTSTATHESANPYPLSFRPKAPYNARALLADLEAILRRFRPTVVALPHPGDRHSDHWSTYGLGTAALYETGQAGVRALYYLVHRRGWSEPPRARDASVFSPPDRLDTWQALTLTPRQQARQRAALACYRTQLEVLHSFMEQFLGPVELFASVPPRELPPEGVAARGERESAPVIPAPPTGVPPTHFGSVWASADGDTLHLRFRLNVATEAPVSYRVYLHSLAGGRVAPPEEYVLDPAQPSGGVKVRAAGHTLEAEVPWRKECAGVLLAAEARVSDAPPDRTRWVLLRAP